MASYTQAPAYQTYQTQGYQLPAQQIIGAINAKSQYYLQTAQQLKNQYDTTFDFNLSNEINKNSIRAQQAEIDNQMKDLVKKDLTISDNSSSIRNLFKPIMQNTSYIADEQLTNKIQSGFRDAQSDLKRKGSDHYNIKSIQVLNNTLEDWKNDDPSNIDRYTSDALGTTYQPYDPAVDKEFNKTIQDRVKNGKIKVDVPDGSGRIVTTEYVDMNSQQAKEYVRSIRPQQQVVQDQLDAKIYTSAFRKASPQEQQQLATYVEGVKNYNIHKEVGAIEADKHKLETQYALLPKETQEKNDVKKAYHTNLEDYNDRIVKAQAMYSDFDNKAYFDPHKKNVAENQLQSILSQRNINGIVDGMGLDKTSTTIKTDASYWSARNLEFNEKKFLAEQEYKKMDLILKASKADKDAKAAKVVPSTSDNIQAAGDVSEIGTAGLNDAQKIDVKGKEMQTAIAGELEAKKSDVASGLFSKLGIMVNTGVDNEDFFSALDKVDNRAPIGNLLDSLSGGATTPSGEFTTNRKLINALINEGTAKMTGGRLFKESTIPTIKASQAKVAIKAALDDPKIFNAAINKAELDTGDFSVADYIGYQKGQIAYDEKTQAQKYGSTYQTAASVLPVPGAKNKPFEELKHYDQMSYARDLSPQLRSMGFNDKDVVDFGRYLKGQETNNVKIKSGSPSSPYEDPLSSFTTSLRLNPTLEHFVKGWQDYQKALNTGLTAISTGASNYNTKSYSVIPEMKENFDASRQLVKSDFITLIKNNTTEATLQGQTQDAEFLGKVKDLVSSDKDAVAGFSAYSDGRNNFITLNINKSAENDKIIKSFKLDPQDLVNLKIQVDNSGIQKLGFKPQSEATSDIQKGKTFGSALRSGKSFSFYNSGSAASPNVAFDGSLLVANVEPNTATFAINERTTANFVKNYKDNALQQAIATGHADDVASHIYQQDAEAKRIVDILDKYHINYKDQNLVFAQLPQKVKDELKTNTVSFKNRKD
jgi:hypothetical protein